MKTSSKTNLIKFLFTPVYGLYVFLIVSLLNLFIVPTIFTALLFLYSSYWTPILWTILLIPPFIISYYLKKTHFVEKTYIPIIQTVVVIAIFIPLSEVLLTPMAMYIFEKESEPIAIIFDINEMQQTLLNNSSNCQEIVFHPTNSKLQKDSVRNNIDQTSLSKAAKQSILQDETSWLYFAPLNNRPKSYFSNSILYVKEVDQSVYSQIGLSIAKDLLGCAHKKRIPETDPEYSLLTTDEYQVIRKAEIEEDINELQKEVNKLDKNIKEYEIWLKEARTSYNNNKGSQLLSYIRQAEDDIKWLRSYRTDYINWISEMETSANGTIPESGVFLAPNKIHVELITLKSSDYSEHIISTILHEYLHYSSFQKDALYPTFFNEGITEILNIDIKRKNSIYVQTYSYQRRIYIIRKMLEDIKYEVLIDTYFAQDEEKLKQILDDTYGAYFYDNNKQYFDLIANLPSYESLDTMNILLKNMGKKEITLEELTDYPGYNVKVITVGQKMN